MLSKQEPERTFLYPVEHIIRDFETLKNRYFFIDSLLSVMPDNLIKVRINMSYNGKNNPFDFIIWTGMYREFLIDLTTMNYIRYKYQTLVQDMIPSKPNYFYIKYLTRSKMIHTNVNPSFKPQCLERIIEFLLF